MGALSLVICILIRNLLGITMGYHLWLSLSGIRNCKHFLDLNYKRTSRPMFGIVLVGARVSNFASMNIKASTMKQPQKIGGAMIFIPKEMIFGHTVSMAGYNCRKMQDKNLSN